MLERLVILGSDESESKTRTAGCVPLVGGRGHGKNQGLRSPSHPWHRSLVCGEGVSEHCALRSGPRP